MFPSRGTLGPHLGKNLRGGFDSPRSALASGSRATLCATILPQPEFSNFL